MQLADVVAESGRRLVEALNLDTGDALGRWRAHRLVELALTAREGATKRARERAAVGFESLAGTTWSHGRQVAIPPPQNPKDLLKLVAD